MMDRVTFEELAKEMLALSPHGFGELTPSHSFTNDGVVMLTQDEDRALVGFGIASSITPTFEVLAAVAKLNQRMTYGHYWLAEGSTNDHWSLVCGFKFPYGMLERQEVGQLLNGLVQHNASMIGAAREALGDAHSTPYWTGDSLGASALVLIGHLG